MPDWNTIFGNASAAQVALWIVAIAAVIGLTLKACHVGWVQRGVVK